MPKLRDTVPVKCVLGALLEQPEAERYASELGGSPATVSNVLKRLVELGWAQSRREDGDPAVLERPLRVYYRLVPEKVEEARAWLAAARPMPVFAPVDLS